MKKRIYVYSTQWCGDCRRAKRFLDSRKVSYTEVDIDQNDAAAQQVMRWSGGRRVIPTFAIEDVNDGETVILHNPPLNILAKELEIS